MALRGTRGLSLSVGAGARREVVLLTLLVASALALRLILMFSLRTYEFPSEQSRVGWEMGWIAWHLANGEGFKLGEHYTAWMAPLYPYLLSLVLRVFDYSSPSATIATLGLQSLLSSLTVLPLYFIARRLFSARVARIAALLWVFHPASLRFAVSFVWSSSLASLGLTLMTALFLWLRDRPFSMGGAVLCGVVVGVAGLSDPVVMAAVPFAGLWLLGRARGNRRAAATQLGVVALTAAIVLAPWTVRNYRLFDRFVPIKATFGTNLWLGNHAVDLDQQTAGLDLWNRIAEEFSAEEVADLESQDEASRDRTLRDRALAFIVAHPRIFAEYTQQRIYLYWTSNVGRRYPLLNAVLLGMLPLAGLGALLAWRRRTDVTLLILILAWLPVVHYLTIAAYPRFRFPIEGLMLVLVARALDGLGAAASRATRRMTRGRQASLAALPAAPTQERVSPCERSDPRSP